jgi:hypothetical protein
MAEIPNQNITITQSASEFAAANPEVAKELGYQGEITEAPTETPSETPSEPVAQEAQDAEATPTTEAVEETTTTEGEVTPDDASTEEVVEEEAQASEETDTPTAFDVDAIAEQFAADGKINDEAKSAIADALAKVEGFDADTAAKYVDVYEQGLGAIARVQELESQIASNELLSSVGGEESFNKIAEWSRANMTAEDVEKYDRLLSNFDTAGDALAVLKERYELANGSSRTVIKGDSAPSTDGPKPILSKRELTSIQRSEEYKNNPQFRAEVQARLAAGMKSGQYDPR